MVMVMAGCRCRRHLERTYFARIILDCACLRPVFFVAAAMETGRAAYCIRTEEKASIPLFRFWPATVAPAKQKINLNRIIREVDDVSTRERSETGQNNPKKPTSPEPGVHPPKIVARRLVVASGPPKFARWESLLGVGPRACIATTGRNQSRRSIVFAE